MHDNKKMNMDTVFNVHADQKLLPFFLLISNLSFFLLHRAFCIERIVTENRKQPLLFTTNIILTIGWNNVFPLIVIV